MLVFRDNRPRGLAGVSGLLALDLDLWITNQVFCGHSATLLGNSAAAARRLWIFHSAVAAYTPISLVKVSYTEARRLVLITRGKKRSGCTYAP